MKFEINKYQMEQLFKLDNNLIYEIFGKEKVNILLENPFLNSFNPELIYVLTNTDGSAYKMDIFSYIDVENPHKIEYVFRDLSIADFNKPIKGTYNEIVAMLKSDESYSTIVFDTEHKFGKWYHNFIKNKYFN